MKEVFSIYFKQTVSSKYQSSSQWGRRVSVATYVDNTVISRCHFFSKTEVNGHFRVGINGRLSVNLQIANWRTLAVVWLCLLAPKQATHEWIPFQLYSVKGTGRVYRWAETKSHRDWWIHFPRVSVQKWTQQTNSKSTDSTIHADRHYAT